MPKETRMFFISLSQVFKKICSKVIDPNIIEVLKAKTAETMSTTEKVCPQSAAWRLGYLNEETLGFYT
jgi:hypothetical protein